MSAPAHATDVRDGVAAYQSGDYAAALRAWRPLAELGDANAQAGLGLLYARGQGVAQDYVEAAKWFRRSADQGNALAQNNLGVMYRNGYGVPQNFPEAVLWYRLSAAQGYALAQSSLAEMYQNGDGIRRDLVEAYMWYTLAADQGHAAAHRSRLALGDQMSVDQRWTALARAQERQRGGTGEGLQAATGSVSPQSDSTDAAPVATTPDLATAGNAGPDIGTPVVPSASAPDTEAAAPTNMAAAWKIQLISLKSEADAIAAAAALRRQNLDLLGDLTLRVQSADLANGTFYRVQAGPLADQAAAAALCATLGTRKQDCLVVAPARSQAQRTVAPAGSGSE